MIPPAFLFSWCKNDQLELAKALGIADDFDVSDLSVSQSDLYAGRAM